MSGKVSNKRGKDPFCDPDNIMKQAYYETKYTYVLYNLYPVIKGHTLIIPKRHVSDLESLTRPEAVDMIDTIRYVTPKLLKIYKADSSYNLVAQIGPYSGRSQEHLHIHIIPRNKYDMYRDYNDRLYEDLRKYELKRIAIHKIEPEVEKLRKVFKYKLGPR
ncbi:MAG: HIT domain-containing protein [Candidatus Micrarchaeia archaeon]